MCDLKAGQRVTSPGGDGRVVEVQGDYVVIMVAGQVHRLRVELVKPAGGLRYA